MAVRATKSALTFQGRVSVRTGRRGQGNTHLAFLAAHDSLAMLDPPTGTRSVLSIPDRRKMDCKFYSRPLLTGCHLKRTPATVSQQQSSAAWHGLPTGLLAAPVAAVARGTVSRCLSPVRSAQGGGYPPLRASQDEGDPCLGGAQQGCLLLIVLLGATELSDRDGVRFTDRARARMCLR